MTVANMEEQIKMLLELQALDLEISSKKRMLNEIPESIKELDDLIESKSSNLKKLEEDLKSTQLKRKEKETELASKEASIKKYQGQLFQVKTNKEYTALENEIASIKADNSLLEEDILRFFDEADVLSKEIDKEKELLALEKKKIDAQKVTMESERKKAEDEFKELQGKREGFSKNIDRNVLSTYERILENRSELAMVPIVRGTCGGCNMNLPPQVINEVRLKKDLVFCGNCSRILYYEDKVGI